MLHEFEIAPVLTSKKVGSIICCVGAPVCLDASNFRHRLVTVPQGEPFIYTGKLDAGKSSYSFLRVEVVEGNSPVVLNESPDSRLLGYEACTWEGAREIIELCCGLGAMGEGARACGFSPLIGCDFRPTMSGLFEQQEGKRVVTADICSVDTLVKIYELHPKSCVLAAGISCQPYSLLGDKQGGNDERASTLPAALAAAYYLRSMVLVLECVSPAQNDPFVRHHLQNFCSKTGFCKTDCVMELKEVWPCRRNRWWCVLAAPALGSIPLKQCPSFLDLPTIECVLPRLKVWPTCEENELKLTPVELEAFQDRENSSVSHQLNKKGPLPCALHCWGSQLTPCPCGCRPKGLSATRLQVRGLFGVIVHSLEDHRPRHLHPTEVAALCGLDPGLIWKAPKRLILGAVGQLASPIQAIWIFSQIMKCLQVAQYQRSDIDPTVMLMAYRSAPSKMHASLESGGH